MSACSDFLLSCNAQAFKSKKLGKSADMLLFDFVEAYFRDAALDFDSKVRLTSRPPLYFQHPGHSMTIVGFEKKTDGSKNLIVFDPMFHDAANIMRLVDAPPFKQKSPADMLKAYRRGAKYLKRHNMFEILEYVCQLYLLFPPFTQLSSCYKSNIWCTSYFCQFSLSYLSPNKMTDVNYFID